MTSILARILATVRPKIRIIFGNIVVAEKAFLTLDNLVTPLLLNIWRDFRLFVSGIPIKSGFELDVNTKLNEVLRRHLTLRRMMTPLMKKSVK